MALSDKLAEQAAPVSKREALGRIANLLERNGIDIDEVGRVQRVSLYQSLTKNDEGEAEIHDLVGVQLSPSWEDGPRWELPKPGPVYKLPSRKAQKVDRDLNVCVTLPDCQIGYYRLADDELAPTHDEAAISCALEVLRATRPDLVVLHGDNLDLPEFSTKYLTTAPFQRTTQASIDRAALLAAQLRDAAPDAEIVWLAGNHEERLPRLLAQNAAAAFGLRRGNIPDSFPVLSVPFLCRLDEYSIQYVPGYPASSWWINERLRVVHGDKVNSSGSTASKYLGREKVSVLYGHIHRLEWAERTREDFDGPRTILAASPGCLARIDGAVPSVKGGTDLDGRPVVRHEDWQQGLAVVEYEPGDGYFNLELVPIREGHARWRGVSYSAANE